jgi:hypothetical protein
MSGITHVQGLISPLFHEGAQNLRATPPVCSAYIASDFDLPARGKREPGWECLRYRTAGAFPGWRVDPQRGHPAAVHDRATGEE